MTDADDEERKGTGRRGSQWSVEVKEQSKEKECDIIFHSTSAAITLNERKKGGPDLV